MQGLARGKKIGQFVCLRMFGKKDPQLQRLLGSVVLFGRSLPLPFVVELTVWAIP